jgi:hypothetical protein
MTTIFLLKPEEEFEVLVYYGRLMVLKGVANAGG